MSVVKEFKNTPQKVAEKVDDNKRIKINDMIFFDKGGVDIFQQWVIKRLEWTVTLSRAPVHRSERWLIIKGKPKVSINKKKYFLRVGQSIFVPRKSIHRIENIYSTPVQIVEVQMGSILKETDIIRYKDIYGRVN